MAVDLEKILRPVDNPIPPFPPKYMMLAGGEEMVIRQVTREDIPDILHHVEPLLHVERDYYDVVAARLYSELLAYYRHRVQDEYVLVAQIDGELVAVVNGRLLEQGRWHVVSHRGAAARLACRRARLCHEDGVPPRHHRSKGSSDCGRIADRLPPMDD